MTCLRTLSCVLLLVGGAGCSGEKDTEVSGDASVVGDAETHFVRGDAGPGADAEMETEGGGGDGGSLPADAAVQMMHDAGIDISAEPGQVTLVGVGNWGLRGRSEAGDSWFECGNRPTPDEHSADLLRSVAYGDGVFVAVGGDENSMIMRSVDGQHWEEDLHPLDACEGASFPVSCEQALAGVAYGGGVWLAGGAKGVLLTSTDAGRTWQTVMPNPRPTAIRQLLHADGRFVAVTEAGAIVISDDYGVNWAEQSLVEAQATLRLAYGDGAFVAWGQSVNDADGYERVCFVSVDDASSWTACSEDLAGVVSAFLYDGQRWIARREGGYLTSTDLQAWTDHAVEGMPAELVFDGTAYFGRRPEGVVARSTDLMTWEDVATGVAPFRSWVAGKVLDRSVAELPVESEACQDLR